MQLISRNNKIIRLFWFVLGLYFLNISVDATDSLYAEKKENLTINNQESIIEIVIEKVFGFDNAIAELDDNDNSQSSIFKKIKSFEYIIEYHKSTGFPTPIISCSKEADKLTIQHISNPLLEIISPPPKV
jgi:hypothetical protein